METITKESLKQEILEKLRLNFGCTVNEATDANMMKACAMVIRDKMSANAVETRAKVRRKQARKVHYMSLEFLMGRSLMKNAYNLGVLKPLKEAIEDLGFKSAHIFDMEPDAGLGNGGLGRLAACYMDSLATLEIPACGYSICYELGIFRQKIVDGQQLELPDNWKDQGDAWLIPKPDEVEEVHFGGTLREFWDDDHLHIINEGYTRVLAVPCDMSIAGYNTKHTNTLRLWDAKSPTPIDMSLFSQGEYLRASEEKAMAEVIAKVLYPEDNHTDGKLLRLSQQYFLVSASIQDIIRRHLYAHGNLDKLPELAAIHLNDTHPVLAIPEMMRVMLDECGYGWDAAWDIVKRTVAYTNHTVMSEALETWNRDLFKMRLPRIYQIVEEIDRRFWNEMRAKGVDESKIYRMAPLNDGYVKMANLAVIGSHNVNGVSALHSEILKDDVFHDFYEEEPQKFTNVTNGIAHRRWLNQSNPKLAGLITDLIGKNYIYDADKLQGLLKYKDDAAVLQKLQEIKQGNKERLAKYLKKTQGDMVDPSTLFDVQVKRLHEYKRQHMNALNILATYQWLRENPNADFVPHTYFFGAKAAPGYYFAKQIIQFIAALAKTINADERVNKKLKVIFVENYCVTWAELLTPAAEISEQISLAGTEASGTSNMKFMINGAITLGTLDGANVEIHETVGDENIFLFGMTASQVEELKRAGYHPQNQYQNDGLIHRAMDELGSMNGGQFKEIFNTLLREDRYMALADLRSYHEAQQRAQQLYRDQTAWNRMSLVNIAGAGRFAADRAIRDYAGNIWHASPVPPVKNLSAKKPEK